MKTRNFFQVLLLFVFIIQSQSIAQVDLKPKNPELGLNPIVPLPSALFRVSDFDNIRLFPSSNHQSETSIALDPLDINNLLSGANTDPGQ